MATIYKRIAEVAEERNLSLKNLRRACKRKHLEAVQTGSGANSPYRVTDEAVDAWLKACRVENVRGRQW